MESARFPKHYKGYRPLLVLQVNSCKALTLERSISHIKPASSTLSSYEGWCLTVDSMIAVDSEKMSKSLGK